MSAATPTADDQVTTMQARQEDIKKLLQNFSLPQAPGAPPKATRLVVQDLLLPSDSAENNNNINNNKKKATSTSTSSCLVPHQAPLLEKTDTHWDFVLKEMQWLATDFCSERKRHIQSRRKLANGIRQYFKTKESRALAALTQAEVKRRRLAAKMGRLVTKWWNKMDQIVTYQQKLIHDQERRQAMNRKLVKLVQQTETYTKSLVDKGASLACQKKRINNTGKRKRDDQGDDEELEGDFHDERDNELLYQFRIEEALAVGQRRRKIHDYARLAKLEDEQQRNETEQSGTDHIRTRHLLYGESTTDDSGSDAAFELGEGSSLDDETTLEQAEMEEQLERGEHDSYVPDPVELKKLKEESTMDIDQVLERLRNELPTLSEADVEKMLQEEETPDKGDNDKDSGCKRVQFSLDVQIMEVPHAQEQSFATDEVAVVASASPASLTDPGDEADDDGDTSDVEDFALQALRCNSNSKRNSNDENDENDEFVNVEQAVDDETTMIEEERLPQEMTPQEEINSLEQENELPIEELRARYAAALAPASCLDSEDDDEDPSNKGRGLGDDDIEQNQSEPCDSNEPAKPQMKDEGVKDEYFKPPVAMEVDSTAIEAEEKLGRDISHGDELTMLTREDGVSVEEFRAMYTQMDQSEASKETAALTQQQIGNRNVGSLPTDECDVKPRTSARQQNRRMARLMSAQTDVPTDTGDKDDGEFEPKPDDEVDDETTIATEEKLGREMSYEEELAMLERDNEMSVEELRAMYAGGNGDDDGASNERREGCKQDTDPKTDGSVESDTEESQPKRKRNDDSPKTDSAKRNKPDEKPEVGAEALDALENSAELAKSTLATRPYLLANWVKLREYQQVGLNWLVSMQTRRLNGILADEMGLGKTLQTISLIAYLASYKGIWGPHLIVVPTSVIVNWETEFKRFCPGLKVLCYYGSAKRRKELRTGWTKTNWNHVVITSYQLAVQDAFAFKRKRWYYMVLDEAQNIKNFQSQRWQTLINFNTQRRLLLTGTPLQNSLMELWSLLHFLMPYIFRSRKEFSFWFENPMNDMIEGTAANENASVINRLHGIIRPFVLRRLKKDVETQMPGKYEHIVKCSLSRRQMLMYEEFMARSSTRKALKKGGNFLGMMNVLMQLRKVCNHPDLFEPRSVITPFVVDPVEAPMPSCVFGMTRARSVFAETSGFLRMPLWSGSMGDVGFNNALRHDDVECEQLRRLEKEIPPPIHKPCLIPTDQIVNEELFNLEKDLQRKRFEDRSGIKDFLNMLNSWRCRRPSFPLSGRLLDRLDFINKEDKRESADLSSPSHFLALRKDQMQRSEESDEMIKNFVFCVPKAGVKPATQLSHIAQSTSFDQMLMEPVEEYMRPFSRAWARLSSFFPDKKLIQFDAGKLQTLAELLRELKRGGHRTLIFTQMSKMLDILEAFLNLNGHTYMRLDGSTGVDRRQRLMDRFNNDPKIFAFILSTRSGGTGVNLIGADTVVFYDSDWNPAMDAQAQDRVHRIGQTRDCHVYRLVTEHSIEENILIKARQKKNLDILVMDRGKFDSSHLFSHDQSARLSSENSEAQDMRDVYTRGGLRAILGMSQEDEEEEEEEIKEEGTESTDNEKKDMTNEQMENAMAALEDVDDVEALRGAKQEAAEELQEFDESGEVTNVDTASASGDSKQEKEIKGNEDDNEDEEKELEKELESWQTKVGMDKDAIEASLSPVERYGFHFRTDTDPYVSLYAVLEYKRKIEEEEEEEDQIDIDEIEREKAEEERQALADGDLLGTDPVPSDLLRYRNLFQRESARLKASKKKRTLTGEGWEIRLDERYKQNFWYNTDTGEAMWDKPRVLVELEEYETAHEQKWSALPQNPLIHVMSYLQPHPDRLAGASRVCHHWHRAATHPSFVLHVYPVEQQSVRKMECSHYSSIQEAILAAKPGDTIELGDGHYWINDDIEVSVPLCIIGDENNPNNVVVEMNGSAIHWRARGGWIEGVTFRRPQLNASGQPLTKSLFSICNGALDVFQCAFNNEGSTGKAITVFGPDAKGRWEQVQVQGGILDEYQSLNINKKIATRI